MTLSESRAAGDFGHISDHNTLHDFYNDFGGASPVFDVKNPEYGATGDGTTDDTAAIQAAIDAAEAAGGGIVWVPQTSNPGTTFYSVTALTIDSDGVQLVGPSFTASEIKSTTGTVLTIGSCEDVLVKNLELTTTSAGNHCIDVTGAAVIRLRVEHCKLSSESNTSSAINASGSGWQMLECAFVDNVYSSWAGSVPIINWTGAINGGCNLNRISGGRIIGGARTETMILLECDRANYFYDNVIENINFEIPTKGCVRANGTKGLTIRNCGVYDLVTATDDMFQFGSDGGSGLVSIDTLISNVRRTSSGTGTLDTFFDVKVTSTSCSGVIINSSAHPAGDTKYDLGSSTRFVVIGAHVSDTISNASGCQVFYTDGGGQVRLGTKVGFYGTTPVAQQTGVAVSAAGIHAALVNLGLITA